MVLQRKDVENTHILLQTLTKWTLQLSQPFNNKNPTRSQAEGIMLKYLVKDFKGMNTQSFKADIAIHTPSGAWTCILSSNSCDFH